MKESSLPTKEKGNLVLEAHNGTARISYFKELHRLETGDVAYIYYQGIKYTYQVNTIYDVLKDGDVEVMRDEAGIYNISGRYDHDSNYNVQNALQQGGYLDYFGMKYVEDGFSYQVNGIDPNHNSSLSIDDNRMYITDKYLVSSLQERFGSTITIKTSWTRDNRASVSFEFHE